jgi:hypothetical protein
MIRQAGRSLRLIYMTHINLCVNEISPFTNESKLLTDNVQRPTTTTPPPSACSPAAEQRSSEATKEAKRQSPSFIWTVTISRIFGYQHYMAVFSAG